METLYRRFRPGGYHYRLVENNPGVRDTLQPDSIAKVVLSSQNSRRFQALMLLTSPRSNVCLFV
jgi:hypothetical protein